MASTTQRTTTALDHTKLTPLQIQAYLQTGICMTQQQAHQHLLQQLTLQQLRDLHASTAKAAASTAIRKAQATAGTASAFAGVCGGYADTGADMLDSNFAALRSLPPAEVDQIASEARMQADAELAAYTSAVLRSPWTKAALCALAIAALFALTGCGGSDQPADLEPAIYTTKNSKVTT
jgi:hypothetical protein